jgi:hypothetical protein
MSWSLETAFPTVLSELAEVKSVRARDAMSTSELMKTSSKGTPREDPMLCRRLKATACERVTAPAFSGKGSRAKMASTPFSRSVSVVATRPWEGDELWEIEMVEEGVLVGDGVMEGVGVTESLGRELPLTAKEVDEKTDGAAESDTSAVSEGAREACTLIDAAAVGEPLLELAAEAESIGALVTLADEKAVALEEKDFWGAEDTVPLDDTEDDFEEDEETWGEIVDDREEICEGDAREDGVEEGERRLELDSSADGEDETETATETVGRVLLEPESVAAGDRETREEREGVLGADWDRVGKGVALRDADALELLEEEVLLLAVGVLQAEEVRLAEGDELMERREELVTSPDEEAIDEAVRKASDAVWLEDPLALASDDKEGVLERDSVADELVDPAGEPLRLPQEVDVLEALAQLLRPADAVPELEVPGLNEAWNEREGDKDDDNDGVIDREINGLRLDDWQEDAQELTLLEGETEPVQRRDDEKRMEGEGKLDCEPIRFVGVEQNEGTGDWDEDNEPEVENELEWEYARDVVKTGVCDSVREANGEDEMERLEEWQLELVMEGVADNTSETVEYFDSEGEEDNEKIGERDGKELLEAAARDREERGELVRYPLEDHNGEKVGTEDWETKEEADMLFLALVIEVGELVKQAPRVAEGSVEYDVAALWDSGALNVKVCERRADNETSALAVLEGDNPGEAEATELWEELGLVLVDVDSVAMRDAVRRSDVVTLALPKAEAEEGKLTEAVSDTDAESVRG